VRVDTRLGTDGDGLPHGTGTVLRHGTLRATAAAGRPAVSDLIRAAVAGRHAALN
jgi:hypothetical protein